MPEIGTPGSESGRRKRAHRPQSAARCESAGLATDALPATRLPSTLPGALSTRKRFEKPVGDVVHLLSRVIDHTIAFGPGREANRNV